MIRADRTAGVVEVIVKVSMFGRPLLGWKVPLLVTTMASTNPCANVLDGHEWPYFHEVYFGS